MSEFNFNSAICTSKSQSERLLALGLKKETADMGWQIISINGETVEMKTEDNWERQEVVKNHFPAWSLHRLIEILDINPCIVYSNDVYGNIIDRIEDYIKEGYFYKEYLV